MTRPVALITGAAKRIGGVISGALAANGYRVAIHYNRSAMDAETLSKKLNDAHGDGTAELFRADLFDKPSLAQLPRTVFEKFGRLDLLINNASVFGQSPLDENIAAAVENYHAIHVTAPTVLAVNAAPYLKMAKPGRIINMVDMFADFTKPGYLPYIISKAGLKSLTRQLAVELAPDVLVNAVAPGAILEAVDGGADLTSAILAKIPLGRFGEAEEIAETVLFLARAGYITGQTIVADGGRSLRV